MLQKRARQKYHCGGLWSNTCCSHPQPGEPTEKAARRKLKEEMGFNCPLKEIFSFVYKVNFANGLWEHEYDHVFIGRFDGEPILNRKEAGDWRWVGLKELKKETQSSPDHYTFWFKLCLDRVVDYFSNLR